MSTEIVAKSEVYLIWTSMKAELCHSSAPMCVMLSKEVLQSFISQLFSNKKEKNIHVHLWYLFQAKCSKRVLMAYCKLFS